MDVVRIVCVLGLLSPTPSLLAIAGASVTRGMTQEEEHEKPTHVVGCSVANSQSHPSRRGGHAGRSLTNSTRPRRDVLAPVSLHCLRGHRLADGHCAPLLA